MTHPAASGQATVLMVDDCAEDRELFAHLLLAAGYRVLEANGAQQAQRLAGAEGKIDLLLTDFNMPGMNGVELARWFQSRFPLSKVLLVSDSAWKLEPSLETTGWPAFLDKTEAFARLAATVEKLLAEATTHLQGFGAAEIAKRPSAETMVRNGAQTGEPANAALQCQRSPPHRVLVVDDESNMRKLNTEFLIAYGYHVDAAEDGAVAWDTLQTKSYDLLITDNTMPKVTGVELIEKVRAAGMPLPVIMATATLPKQTFARNPWLQPAATLLKPYTLAELLGTVKHVLCAAAP